ncbi:hypothetical protein [Tychonema sp. BBK16]|uniref:hypothetical protein n=1 Tax=Tychonema sp. BBK16 TaxID=2699888 RepID=UPI001F254FB3|nr:hypothetical protein [Tychonema sp. BBK16]MCF6374738.1 hypothetical protein [Tychonema sp. BBK16]
MNNILHRLAMATLATAAIFTINTLNNLTESSATTKFDGAEINHRETFPVAFSHFNK